MFGGGGGECVPASPFRLGFEARPGGRIVQEYRDSEDADGSDLVAGRAEGVVATWRDPDSGIWEVRSEPRHFTQSKMMCWVALDRAAHLAERSLIPDRHLARWQAAREEIATFIETCCVSQRRNCYMRSAGSEDLDAKDPSCNDTRYVDELVASGVVNTMPEQTLRAVADHGRIHGDTIHGTFATSQQVLDDLEALGVSYHDVVRVLENEGIAKFTASGTELFEQLEVELHTKRSAV